MTGDEVAPGPSGAPGAASARDAVRATIVELLAREGNLLVEDPRRVEAFLRDLCGAHPAEISVAVAALRAGLASELNAGRSTRSQPAALLLPRLAARLHEDLGIDESLARWAVGTWALALHTADAALVKSMDPPAERPRDPYLPGDTAHRGVSGPAQEGLSPWPSDEETASIALEGLELADSQAGSPRRPASGRAGSGRAGEARRGPTMAGMLGTLGTLRTWRARVIAASVLVIVVAGVVSALASEQGSGARRSAPPGHSAPGSSGVPLGQAGSSAKGVFDVPPLGTYRYETTITGGSYPAPATSSSGSNISTAEVIRVGNQIGVAWTGFGNTLVQSDLYTMTPQSIIETSTELLDSSGAAASSACVWSPPIVEYQQPMLPGRSWSQDSSCSLTSSGSSGNIKEVGQTRVVKTERVNVPLGSFEAVLVDINLTTTVTLSGSAPSTDTETDAIALDPSTGVPISEALYDHKTGQTVLAKLQGFTPLSSASSG